ncbi:MAG: carboxylate-amine ligase [Acidobacteriota bacterium]|nr:carboxylate-amine ligase [Acidobacteriota bacterium]
MRSPSLTIGIEEEYQIVDPQTGELTSYIQELLDQGHWVLHDQLKAEFMQSQIEVGSRICANVQEAREELVRLRSSVYDLAQENGLVVVAASTHPFSEWTQQEVSAGERYTKLEKDFGEVARRLLIFGMHIHIGIEDKDLLIDVMNQAQYFLPHILALSTSSPFWHGRATGLKSYRSVVFENLPRTGVAPLFQSWRQYEGEIDTLVSTGCIEDATKIWWDVRPHPKFGTLEFRVCDICTRVDEAICITALLQAIVAKLIQLRRRNTTWRLYPRHLITENKWRAVRYGIDGQMIDFGKRKEVSMRDLTLELLEILDDVIDELGTRKEIEHVHRIFEEGTSADRQLRVFEETGDLGSVIDHLAAETMEGC